MDPLVFARGALLGLSIATPVGPIGLLCIRRTLAQGRITGLLSGLGAATADALYGAVAAFGLTTIASILVGGAFWLRLCGGLFLCYLGGKTLLSRPAQSSATTAAGLLASYASTLVLTLSNPTTIFSFIGLFAGLGVATAAARDYPSAALLVAGVFAGSALWWLILSTGISALRTRVTAGHLVWLNRGSGLLIIAFGLTALLGLL